MARRRSRYDDAQWPYYTSSRPIRAAGGLKAKSQRGQFVKSWWGDRWIRALDQLMEPQRLRRGRTYARQGQVLQIDVASGHVSARVQGSRPRPYQIEIQLRPLNNGQWDRVLDALGEQALFAAQLLNGEMPPDVEQVFDAVQVPLFPVSRGDLKTECSCPDWANPCKHIAAVYYLLGERFDQDPFLLFELRGRTKEQVMAALRERRAQGALTLEEPSTAYEVDQDQAEARSLAKDLSSFWTLGPEAQQVSLTLGPPQIDMALLKRLGAPDWVDAQSFWPSMERVYAAVAKRALELAFAEVDTQQESDPDSET